MWCKEALGWTRINLSVRCAAKTDLLENSGTPIRDSSAAAAAAESAHTALIQTNIKASTLVYGVLPLMKRASSPCGAESSRAAECGMIKTWEPSKERGKKKKLSGNGDDAVRSDQRVRVCVGCSHRASGDEKKPHNIKVRWW